MPKYDSQSPYIRRDKDDPNAFFLERSRTNGDYIDIWHHIHIDAFSDCFDGESYEIIKDIKPGERIKIKLSLRESN